MGLDKLHAITAQRNMRNLKVGLTPNNRAKNMISKQSQHNVIFPDVAPDVVPENKHKNTMNTMPKKSNILSPKSPSTFGISLKLSFRDIYDDVYVEAVCPSIRGGHRSDVFESEFERFIETELNKKDDDKIIDRNNHQHHALHYNAKNDNVKKMKEMISNLIDDLDRS